MITIDGRDFATVFKSIPSWLGEAPAICYLLFDGETLRVRAMTGVCLADYVFSNLKVSPGTPAFSASVAFDVMAGAFKGQKEIKWEVNNRSLNFQAGKYKGTLVLDTVRNLDWPKIPDVPPAKWIIDLVQGSDTILLKKKVSSTNPLTVFFRQRAGEAILCTADGVHVIVANRKATTVSETDVAIPYQSFELLMKAFKKSESMLLAYVSDTHLIIRNDNLTLSVPVLTESGSMNLDAVIGLIQDTKKNYTAHVLVDGSALAHLSEFVERGKSLQDSDSDRPPPVLVKIQQNSLFCKFETKKGILEDQVMGVVKKGEQGSFILVDPMALMDVLTTLASTNLHFLFVEQNRIAILSTQTNQTGLIVGTST